MRTSPPSWGALLLLPLLSAAQPAPNTTLEIDLLSPLASSIHRVSPTRGLAVLVAIQNRHLGDPAGWRFEWTASRLPASARPRFGASGAVTSHGTNIWGSPTHSLNQSVDGVYLALSHPRIEEVTNRPSTGTMPAGEYEFTWNVQIGPWCEVSEPPEARSREYASNHFINRGMFNFTVVEEGAWPVLTRTAGGECASVAGQVSFTAYSTMVPAWDTKYDEPWGPCAMTASVTEVAAPCRVTMDGEVVGRVAGLMGWDGGPTGTVKASAGGRLRGWGSWGVVVGLNLLVGVL